MTSNISASIRVPRSVKWISYYYQVLATFGLINSVVGLFLFVLAAPLIGPLFVGLDIILIAILALTIKIAKNLLRMDIKSVYYLFIVQILGVGFGFLANQIEPTGLNSFHLRPLHLLFNIMLLVYLWTQLRAKGANL